MASSTKAVNNMMDPDTLDLFGDDLAPRVPSKKEQVVAQPKEDVTVEDEFEQEVEETTQESSDDIDIDVDAPIKVAKAADEPTSSRRKGPKKSRKAFKTISEVATHIGVPQHVLRFWETKFSAIKPMKRGGGRRYYRPDDVEIIEKIHELLYNQGYTIKGVQKLFKAHKKAGFLKLSFEPEVGAVESAAVSQTSKKEETPIVAVSPAQDSKETKEALVAILRSLRAMRRYLNPTD